MVGWWGVGEKDILISICRWGLCWGPALFSPRGHRSLLRTMPLIPLELQQLLPWSGARGRIRVCFKGLTLDSPSSGPSSLELWDD